MEAPTPPEYVLNYDSTSFLGARGLQSTSVLACLNICLRKKMTLQKVKLFSWKRKILPLNVMQHIPHDDYNHSFKNQIRRSNRSLTRPVLINTQITF